MPVKRDALDKVFSDVVREAADYTCQHCRKNYRHQPGYMDCGHVHTRSHRSTRWDARIGAIALCKPCHRRFTAFPLEWADFCRRHLGEGAYDEAKRKAWEVRKYTQAERDEMKAHYRSELERIKSMRMMGAQGVLEIVPYD